MFSYPESFLQTPGAELQESQFNGVWRTLGGLHMNVSW